MALVSNIKGYINGNEWGVVEATATLKTAEEIKGIDNVLDAVEELNKYPTEYYEKFIDKGEITDFKHIDRSRYNEGCFAFFDENSGSMYNGREDENQNTYYIYYHEGLRKSVNTNSVSSIDCYTGTVPPGPRPVVG